MKRIGSEHQSVSLRAAWALACLVCLSATLRAQDALDRVDSISIASRPVGEALKTLSEKTKLNFDIDPAAAELLPYGPKSVITINLQNIPLRRGLTLVFEGLGMRMETVAARVQIVPAPFLDRMNRRLTKAEQEVVYGMARATAFSVANPPATLELRIDGEPNAAQLLDQKLQGIKAENSLRQLEAATDALAWTWRMVERKIVIERRRTYFLQRLGEALTANFVQRPVDVVLSNILEQSHVPLIVENQAFQATGAANRKVDLIARRPAVNLIERICQGAGLEFEVTDSGVVIRPAAGGNAPPAIVPVPPVAPVDEVVELLIEIRTGVWATVRMPKSKVPPELREALERRMREVFGENPPAIGRAQP